MVPIVTTRTLVILVPIKPVATSVTALVIDVSRSSCNMSSTYSRIYRQILINIPTAKPRQQPSGCSLFPRGRADWHVDTEISFCAAALRASWTIHRYMPERVPASEEAYWGECVSVEFHCLWASARWKSCSFVIADTLTVQIMLCLVTACKFDTHLPNCTALPHIRPPS